MKTLKLLSLGLLLIIVFYNLIKGVFGLVDFFLLLFFLTFVLFLKFQRHFFIILMILEIIIIVNVFILSYLIRIMFFNMMVFFTFLTISVCEASIGLSVLIKYSRFWGNEVVEV
jgi:hypothetical protein